MSIGKTLAIEDVPKTLQSFGYFPSNYEMTDIINELKLSGTEERCKTTIEFDELLQG